MKQIKLGILGCGGATVCLHLPALKLLRDKFDICALYDISANRSSYCNTLLPNAKIYESLDEFYAADFDLVAILSNNHEALISKAIIHNKHVFTEKPISLDYQASTQLLHLAGERGLIFESGLMRLYDSVVQRFFDQVDLHSAFSLTLNKSDGSDYIIRRRLLPANFTVYNFANSDTPIMPSGLTQKQQWVLQTLLWSGAHLLTVLCNYFPQITPQKCVIDSEQNGVIVMLYDSTFKVQIILQIHESSVPRYVETIALNASGVCGNINFTSPYLPTESTSAHLSFSNGLEIDLASGAECSPFVLQWEQVYEAVIRGKSTHSAMLSLQIEKIAYTIAKMVE